MQLIMGAVSLWTRPCACVQGPEKSTPQLIKPRRQDLVDELQLLRNHSFPDTPTGMSTTLSKYLPRTPRRPPHGTSTTSRCTPTGMQQPVQTTKNYNCGSSAVSSTTALENWTCTREVDHSVNGQQLENLCGKKPGESATAPRQEINDDQRWTATAETPQFGVLSTNQASVD